MGGARGGPPQLPEPLLHPVVDTHCHLDVHDRSLHGDVEPDAVTALEQAAAVGVTRVVQIGCDLPSARWSVEFVQEHRSVVAGVAIHPNDAARLVERQGEAALDAALAEIEQLATAPRVHAVGETGLDYYRTDGSGHAAQQRSFRFHIDLAKRLGKVLVIHDRDAHEDVINILLQQGPPSTVVFHCFSGDAAMARICADHGWYMSFAGVVTYPNAESLREALLEVPDELVLTETDAPYLPPVPNRGKANASTLMPFTVRAMAQVRGREEAGFARQLWENSERVFGPW